MLSKLWDAKPRLNRHSKRQADVSRGKTLDGCGREMFPVKKWVLVFMVFGVLLTAITASSQIQEREKIELVEAKENQSNDAVWEPIESAISSEETSGAGTSNVIIKPRSNIEIYLSLGVLAFGLILIVFTGFVALKKNSGWDQEATRIFAISVIVTAGLFLITAGYSDQQIAPMFGLLGTIVGYLLGKSPPGEHGSK